MKTKITMIVFLLTLQGCMGADFSRSIGLDSVAPDEFLVTTQNPLEVPKDFTLPKPQDANNSKLAKHEKNLSEGENLILERASQ